jgi:hypothetical protein
MGPGSVSKHRESKKTTNHWADPENMYQPFRTHKFTNELDVVHSAGATQGDFTLKKVRSMIWSVIYEHYRANTSDTSIANWR